MVPLTALWLPILLSAVIVFFVSFIIHMVLPYHRNDFKKVPAEDEFRAAVKKLKIPPGDYVVPCAGGPKELSDPKFVERYTEGPVVFMTVVKSGVPPSLGPSLAMWFAFCVLISFVAAYVAGRALGPDAHYLEVFRFVGCTAFAGHSLGLLQNSIWYKKNWTTTLKTVFDGLVYASFTAGTFGWLWP